MTTSRYANITGIYTTDDKHHAVTLAEYAGHARPGQIIIDTADYSLHVGTADGTFNSVGGGNASSIINGDTEIDIPEPSGDIVFTVNATNQWLLGEDAVLTLPNGGTISEPPIPAPFPGYAVAITPAGTIDDDQKLMIYPTVIGDNNHLHLTTGNLFNTELYLGNDDLYVKLANTGSIQINANDNDGDAALWTFDADGTLTAPGDIKTGMEGGRFIQDCDDGTTSMRWINVEIENDSTQLIRAYSGDPDGEGDSFERAQVAVNWLDGDHSGLTVRSFDRSDSDNTIRHDWKFQGDGNLVLPEGGDILDINGNSVLGGNTDDPNIWVETFAFTDPAESIVQIATSVEYDADGNIFALFSHSIPGGSDTFSSVAKLSPTGTVVWQIRFAANLNTDGWGLAYDGTASVYIAGSTNGTPLTYKFATLTKIDALDGTIVWNKTYDFGADSQSAVVDVDSDSNPIMVGYAANGTDNMIITTKVDQADGTVIWSKTLDGQGNDEAYGMAVGPTGEVVTIGYIDTFGVQDAAGTLYADPVSNANWTIDQTGVLAGELGFDVSFAAGVPTFTNISDTAGGRTVGDTVATILGSILGGADGVDDMIVKVENLAFNDVDRRMVVVKYAADGTIDWQKAVQFDSGYSCSGADADIDTDGNVYVCGQYDNPIGSAMSLVKFDSTGTKQWSRRVEGDCADFATSVVVGPDNNLYLSGVTANPSAQNIIWVVAKYSTTGSVIWQRLIQNSASWTFTGGLFFSNGGGSNIAVGPDYVALAGGFGTLDNNEQPTATVVQIDTNGTPFSTGDWALRAASFNGNLNDTAGDIVVVDAGKTTGSATPTVADFVVVEDSSNFLIGTLYNVTGGVSLGNFAFNGSIITATGDDIHIKSNDDLYLDALEDDVHIRAEDDIRIRAGYNFDADTYRYEWRFNDSGDIVFFNSADSLSHGAIRMDQITAGARLEINGYVGVGISTGDGSEWNFSQGGTLTIPGTTYDESSPISIRGDYGFVFHPSHNTGGTGPDLTISYNDGILITPNTNDYRVSGTTAAPLIIEGSSLDEPGVLPGPLYLVAGTNYNDGAKGDVIVGPYGKQTKFRPDGITESPVLTVATLPAPVAGGKAFISDSSLPAAGNFGQIAITGGSIVVPVWSDGVDWRIG
jgi:hypothetical protein